MTLDEARYLSPEQAIGEPASSESDVYALALILFEAVTGTAAYEGTTPEAILRARLDSPLPVRLELGSLDMVLAQAAVPDPRLRLDAEQFSARLGAVVHDAAPLVVRPGSQELPLLAQFTAQEERSSIGFRPPSAEQIVGASPEPTGGYTRVPRAAANLGAGGGGVPRGPVGRTPRFERGQYDLPRDPRRWGVIIAVLVLLVVVIGAGAAWKSGLFSKSYSVPNLVGKSVKQASAAIKSGSFTLRVTNRVDSAKVPVGNIVTQTPVVGTSEKSGSTITVSVSKGPVLVTMPTNLVGKSCAAATAQLSALHVTATCPATAAIFSPTVPLNDVARVLYQKGQNPLVVPLRAGVTLSLSKGPAPSTTTTTTSTTTTTLAGQGLRAVPNVVGDNQVQLVAAMKKAVLYYTTTGPNANTTKWTKVVSENPAAGTMVPYKSSVTLTVQ
jgi:serine/threonine-protein kinase